MHQVLFRLASAADASLVSGLSRRAYIPAYMSAIGQIPRPATEDYLSRIIGQGVWIASLQEVPVGVLVLEEDPSFLMVYSIAVDPDHQGKGLGAALLQFAEAIAKEQNVAELRLYTNRRMEQNIRLYRRAGFAEIGVRPHPSRPGDFLVDMSKRI